MGGAGVTEAPPDSKTLGPVCTRPPAVGGSPGLGEPCRKLEGEAGSCAGAASSRWGRTVPQRKAGAQGHSFRSGLGASAGFEPLDP